MSAWKTSPIRESLGARPNRLGWRRSVAVGRAGWMAVVLAAGLWSRPAQADVSSWMFVGGGVSHLWFGDQLKLRPNMLAEAGIGTPSSHPWSVGVMYKFQPIFGHGVDMGLAMRVADRGFTTGCWGFALDLGGYQRFTRQSRGLEASAILGAPWGITLRAVGGYGTEDQHHVSVIVGIDLARLTVHRLSGENWWKNSVPAYRPPAESPATEPSALSR